MDAVDVYLILIVDKSYILIKITALLLYSNVTSWI